MNALAVLLWAVLGIGLLWGSWMRRWLTASGVAAAAAVGLGVATGLGWRGLLLVGFFFVSSSLLTWRRARGRVRADETARVGRTGGQVLANGGVATIAALVATAEIWGIAAAALAAAGSLAAATADTWASEIGERAARTTRLVTSWRRVPPGTDGAVSLPGTLAGAAGGLASAALAALLFAEPGWIAPVAAGGLGGMSVDSLLGATLEGRRPWFGNDAVNWAGTCSGALLAIILA